MAAVYTCRICNGWHEKFFQMQQCERSHGDMTREEYFERQKRRNIADDAVMAILDAKKKALVERELAEVRRLNALAGGRSATALAGEASDEGGQ